MQSLRQPELHSAIWDHYRNPSCYPKFFRPIFDTVGEVLHSGKSEGCDDNAPSKRNLLRMSSFDRDFLCKGDLKKQFVKMR